MESYDYSAIKLSWQQRHLLSIRAKLNEKWIYGIYCRVEMINILHLIWDEKNTVIKISCCDTSVGVEAGADVHLASTPALNQLNDVTSNLFIEFCMLIAIGWQKVAGTPHVYNCSLCSLRFPPICARVIFHFYTIR